MRKSIVLRRQQFYWLLMLFKPRFVHSSAHILAKHIYSVMCQILKCSTLLLNWVMLGGITAAGEKSIRCH